jgi:outer membrane immunogenic protein
MRKLALAFSLVAAVTGTASAADLGPMKAPSAVIPAIYDWSGFYTGINAGAGSNHECWDRNTGLGGTFRATEGCHNGTGAAVGGQFGYRWQMSAFVLGLEAQGDWSRLSGSNTSLLDPTTGNRSRIDAFGLFTGQLGFAWNEALFYVKGGGAVTDDRYQGFAALNGAINDTVTEVRWGAVAGAGFEFAFVPNWSVGVEYDHLFMGTRTLDFFTTTFPAAFSREDRIRQGVDLVTLRLNYRWDGPAISKY